MIHLYHLHLSFYKLRSNRKIVITLFLLLCQISAWAAVNDELNCSRVIALDASACCFSLAYNYNFPQGVTSLETNLLNPGVTFSGINYPIGAGWGYETLQNKRRLRWTYQTGQEIPAGDQILFDFCLSGWNPADSVALAVTWRVGNAVAKRDTLQLGCVRCWDAPLETVECQADSSFLYTFDFRNESNFPVDYLLIREPAGQDFIVEEELLLDNPIAIGETIGGLLLHLSPAADGLTEVCFELTPRHLINDAIAVDCCTATYCIPLPECDRCCTEYDVFEEDVAAGFRIDISCENENVRLQAHSLSDCDRVLFDVIGVAQAIVDGDEAVTIAGLVDNQSYEVCMTVTRQNRSGEACYEEASLTFCDNFIYDCDNCLEPEQIDLDFDCPMELDLVCGCDSMTYFNACAAENWAGLTLWEEGRRCNDPQLEEIPLVVTYLQLGMESRLDWSVGGLVSYRYFLIQRQAPDQEEWMSINLVDAMTFSYFDPVASSGTYGYRIVGVVENGKVVFSNEDEVVDTEDVVDQQEGQLWPNPFGDYLQLQLPTPQSLPYQIWNNQGRLILQGSTNYQGQATFDGKSWPAGCYFLTAYLADGGLWQRKLVKI